MPSAKQVLYDAYGQLRGYRRWSIAREVEANRYRSRDAIHALASALFQERVRDAIARFPTYAEAVRAHRGSLPAEGEAVSPAELPVWTKPQQQALFDALDGPPVANAHAHSTGGSTGLPTRFYVTRHSYEWRVAVWRRAHEWADASPQRSSFHVWSAPLRKPALKRRVAKSVLYWLWNREVYNALRAFDDAARADCCRRIDAMKPYTLVGYSGMLVELARYVQDHPGALRHRVQTIVPAAEAMQPGQRELLEQAFGGAVSVSYGSREFMTIGMECAHHDGYHLSSDNLYVEIADDAGAPLPPGEPGRVLVTDLRNLATPFIRYDLGDLSSLRDPGEQCPCGLPFPKLDDVAGRTQSFVTTTSGGKITAIVINYVMRQFAWLDGYQIEQHDREHVTVRVLCRTDLTDAMTAPIGDALREHLGESMRIDYRRVAALEKGRSGKVEYFIGSEA